MSGIMERGQMRVLMDAIPLASTTKDGGELLVPLEVPLEELVELATGRGFRVSEIFFEPGKRGVAIEVPGQDYVLCLFPFNESDGRETVWAMSSKIGLVREAFFNTREEFENDYD